MITLDNSKERNRIKSMFDEGELKYNKGSSYSEKEEGVTIILKGLRLLKNLYETRETDKNMIETYKKLYNERYLDIEKKIKYLEGCKKKVEEVESNGGNAMMKGGSGGGAGGGNEEDKKFQNSLSEAIVTEKPNVKWTDVAGLVNAKKALQEAVILPIKFPEIFKGARKPWKGILLYGPPGTGKTFLAKACATEAEGTFFSISSSDLISKYVGESEKLIKTLFKMAREKRPSIIFIDEIDSLCGSRSDGENDATRRVKSEFLVQMQGVGNDDQGILVLGATNIPWGLDPAIRRRFERRIYIPLPDYEGRLFLVKHNLKNTPHKLSDEEMEIVAKKIDGFSGSDISIFIRDAVFEPVRKMQNANYFMEVMVDGKKRMKPVEDSYAGKSGVHKMKLIDVNPNELLIPEVTYEDVNISLVRAKPSVAGDQLKNYEDFTTSFGQDG